MHVCMVTDTFWPRINGISTSISTLSSTLCELGHQVTIVAPDYAQLPSRRQFIAGQSECAFDVIRFPAHSLLFFPEDCSTTLTSRRYRRQARRLRETAFDIVHTHTPLMLGILSMYWQRGKSVPMVHTFHTLFEEFMPYYFPFCYLPAAITHPFIHWFALNVFHWYCNRFDQVIAPSSQVAHLLQSYCLRTPAVVIPTGIETRRYRGGDRERLRKELGITPREKLFLFVGRVGFEKGIDLILRSLPTVLQAEPATRLAIVGQGPAEGSLRDMARQLGIQAAVHFCGYRPHTEMADVYAAADGFLFASQTESQGLVTIEAMASGTPVVAVRGPGTLDILQNEQGGLLSPPDERAFADRILRLIQDPDLHRIKSAQARQRAESFSSLAMGRQVLDLYESLIDSSSLPSCSESSLTQANLRRRVFG